MQPKPGSLTSSGNFLNGDIESKDRILLGGKKRSQNSEVSSIGDGRSSTFSNLTSQELKEVPVNSIEYLSRRKDQIPADEVFFAKFFSKKMESLSASSLPNLPKDKKEDMRRDKNNDNDNEDDIDDIDDDNDDDSQEESSLALNKLDSLEGDVSSPEEEDGDMSDTEIWNAMRASSGFPTGGDFPDEDVEEMGEEEFQKLMMENQGPDSSEEEEGEEEEEKEKVGPSMNESTFEIESNLNQKGEEEEVDNFSDDSSEYDSQEDEDAEEALLKMALVGDDESDDDDNDRDHGIQVNSSTKPSLPRLGGSKRKLAAKAQHLGYRGDFFNPVMSTSSTSKDNSSALSDRKALGNRKGGKETTLLPTQNVRKLKDFASAEDFEELINAGNDPQVIEEFAKAFGVEKRKIGPRSGGGGGGSSGKAGKKMRKK